MYHKTRDTVLKKVTPQEAQQFGVINVFPGQRTLNQMKVREYMTAMDLGTMRDVDIAVATTPDGKQWLMNGQHVSAAIATRQKPYGARIDYYRCDEYKDLWRLFGTYDSHKARSDMQVLKGARGLLENIGLHAVPLSILHICGTALFCLSLGKKPVFGRAAPNKITKTELVDKYAAEVMWIYSVKPRLGAECNVRFMERVGVVTAMIATKRANSAKADVFWPSVRDIDMVSKNDPRRKLHDRLLMSVSHNSSGSGTHAALYASCISYWNSWMTGRERKTVKWNSMKELPDIISST